MSKSLVGFVFVLAAVLRPSVALAQAPADSARTFLEFQVEQPARAKSSATPAYPERLRSTGMAGEVLIQFIVDERGVAQSGSFKILKSNDVAFTESVKRAVNASSFHPAEVGGKKVRQLVQRSYKFTGSR